MNTPVGYSWSVNSSVTGNWEDFVVKELVPDIDANFRTLANRDSRGIAGDRMGGYGAIRFGMRHPDVFGSVYALHPVGDRIRRADHVHAPQLGALGTRPIRGRITGRPRLDGLHLDLPGTLAQPRTSHSRTSWMNLAFRTKQRNTGVGLATVCGAKTAGFIRTCCRSFRSISCLPLAPRNSGQPRDARLFRHSSETFVPTDPVLVVHGGAWAIPDDMVDAHLRGVRNALAAGWLALSKGGSALDAVEEAIVVLEDDETFDAGRGSFLNREGKVQLDAFIMEGSTLRGGGVGGVERIRNPIRAARKILSESPHVYFVGEGAERFAAEHGITLCNNSELVIPREVERLSAFQAHAAESAPDLFAPAISHDTVGAVALDAEGNIAAGTSTGGTLNKAPGRLGDSSLIGCGCYADNESAAASLTGWGEPIMKLVLAKWSADRVLAGNVPEWVSEEAINYLKARVNGHGGIILLDPRGRFGISHNTPRMAWAYQTKQKQDSGIER